MITRKEQQIRRMRQQVMADPVPAGPPPALQWIIDNLPAEPEPERERPIHPDADRMLQEWNDWIAHG